MYYQTINNILTGRNKESKKIANNTYLKRDGEKFRILFHDTNIVTVNNQNVFTLNSGGYRTKTTKERINDFSPAIIKQDSFIWQIKESAFFDGIDIDKNGNVLNPRPIEDAKKASLTVSKDVREYIKGYVKHVEQNGLENPSGGDCWFCHFNFGGNSVEHIHEHMKEGYYVPSLLFNAIKELGYVEPYFIWQLCKKDSYWIKSILTRYFKKIKPKLIFY